MNQPASQSPTMTVRRHLSELRGRLLFVSAVFFVGAMAAYLFRDSVIRLLLAPLDGQRLSYLTVGGGFSFVFNLVAWCGVVLALPFLFYSMYKFVSPAVPSIAQGRSLLVLGMSFLLLVSGALYGYLLAIPSAIGFLLSYADQYVDSMLTADAYLGFILAYTVGLGVLFQLPLMMLLVSWLRPLSIRGLLSFERYVIVLSFVAAAIITPTPDVANQAMIALPVIGMYQLGVFMVMGANRRVRTGVDSRHSETAMGAR